MPFQCATRNKGKCKDINLCQQFKLQFKQFGNINIEIYPRVTFFIFIDLKNLLPHNFRV